MVKRYIPNRGDIVWLTLDPTLGHEQKGRRPVLVLSSRLYNKNTNLMICCSITSTIRGNPFEVLVSTPKTKGAILADQVRTIAWKERFAKFIVTVEEEVLHDVCEKISLLIEG